MKKALLLLLMLGFVLQTEAYDKKSLVERFTNWGCGPCATLNNAWYNATTQDLVNTGAISHIVYNVDWPSGNDPMYLLNSADNNMRRSYYGVNSVPWIEVNGTTFPNPFPGYEQQFRNVVNNGNAEYAPFSIILTPERFSNDVINVHVKILREPGDNTTFGNVKLRVALTEKTVQFGSPGPNGESVFYSISRKMLPDGNGISFTIPAAGDSTELDLLYIPSAEFIQTVNFDSIRVVAFIQDDELDEVYQSEMADLVFSNNVNAAFSVDENLGAAPLTVTFTDYSTATDSTSIVSWAWDFDNDGTIDSNDPEPTYTYSSVGTYSVALTVSDGVNQHTRVVENYINVLTNTSNILVVNGIEYATYGSEMENFYNSSACFGNHQVDVWDLFGDQGFDYGANPNIQQVILMNRNIPNSILNLYQKVIWIGNSYGGDEAFYDPNQVLDYIAQGGNFLLATREGADFFNNDLKAYCGITAMSGLLNITMLKALDENLVDMPVTGTHSRVQFAWLADSSQAIPIFDADDTTNNWIAGFRIQKDNNGTFIYIAGRPYRLDYNASFQNYDFMIDNWLNFVPVNVEDDNNNNVVTDFKLLQNYPNPFNPSTRIVYTVAEAVPVTIKVFDLTGQEVATLVNDVKAPGTYEVVFDAHNLASGVYIYQMIAGNFSSVKKMSLLK